MRTRLNLTAYTLALLFLLPSAMILAQKKKETNGGKEIPTKKLFKIAKEFIRVEEYHHAEDLFKELVKREPNNPEFNYYLGITYLSTTEEPKYIALDYFRKVLKSGKEYDKLYFYLGRAYHLHHEFDSAITYYDAHLRSDSKLEQEDHPEEIKRLIKQCQTGKKLMQTPENVEIFNLGEKVNTEMPEIAPVISADESRLIFTSRRKDSMGKEIDPLLNLPYEDIYITERDDEGNWTTASNIGKAINTDSHDASIGLSPDGQELFVYRDDENSGQLAAGNIFVSFFKGGKWSSPEKLPEGINSESWETHATITADEKIIVFSSNRENDNAMGGTDLYMVRKLPNGEWAQPFHLGPNINTPYNEEAPYIHPNGKILYFSSEGHESMGGYDIFFCEWDAEKQMWGKPNNIGYPINTADDDVFYTVSADGMRGYFSSIREDSYGGHDIYMVDIPSKEVQIIVLKGKIFDAETGQPLDATVEVVDNETGEHIAISNSNGLNGKYSLFLEPERNYGVRAYKNGYMFKSLNINVPNQFEYLELVENFQLQKTGDKKLEVLNNIFFTETSDILITSDAELRMLMRLMEENPEHLVEIAIHEDNTNDSLVSVFSTQAKADAVTMELKRLGAENQRIVGKGYGFGYNYPVASNLTSQGRVKNSRIEYILRKNEENLPEISYAEVNEVFRDPALFKDFECPSEGDEIVLKHPLDLHKTDNSINDKTKEALDELAMILDRCSDLKVEIQGHSENDGNATEDYYKDRTEKRALIIKQQLVYRGISPYRMNAVGFGSSKPIASNSTDEGRERNNRVTILVKEGEGKIIPAPAIAPEGKDIPDVDEKGSPIIKYKKGEKLGQAVYFEYDSYEITVPEQDKLVKVAKLLNSNRKIKILIGGHTDAKGTANYNLNLGEKRAKAVKEFLSKLGVQKEQFLTKSFGEERSTVEEQDDKSKMAKDRRVDFEILEDVMED